MRVAVFCGSADSCNDCRLFIVRTNPGRRLFSKSPGITKGSFGTEENYVCPVQSLSRSDELIDHFKWVLDREKEIRSHLEATIPEYCKKEFL